MVPEYDRERAWDREVARERLDRENWFKATSRVSKKVEKTPVAIKPVSPKK